MSFSLHVKFRQSIIETKSMIKPKNTFRRPVLHLQHCLIKFASPIHTSRLSPSAIKMWRSELHQLLNREMTVWSLNISISDTIILLVFCYSVLYISPKVSVSTLQSYHLSVKKYSFFNAVVKLCSSYWTWEYSSKPSKSHRVSNDIYIYLLYTI